MATKRKKPAKRATRAPAEPSTAVEAPAPDTTGPIPVVGIGASAGGLAAFEAFFAGWPADKLPGMAFVLVQHLAPDHKSILAELIKRSTTLDVVEVTDGMEIRPNCAFIIPPNRDMALVKGKLHLYEPTAPRGLRLPIDSFFRSLADDQGERAIGIVLSGTGSDGAQGVRAIKAAGGMVMAQSPDSAEYDGMPRACIATGVVDYVLQPSAMAEQLATYVAYGGTGRLPVPHTPVVEKAWRTLFALLASQTGHDFSLYKANTIARRVERRMAVHRLAQLGDYVELLKQSRPEVEALFRDLLIGVTGFFRDPEAFRVLEHEVLPQLLASRQPGETIRVWVPGCSTGEEAYSIAMLLYEQAEALKRNLKLQVFATDLDSAAIEEARAGVYSAAVAAELPPDRLARFFSLDADTGSYRIRKGIRDLLVFSEQDVIKDPPFSRLDLISCRNLMIYLGASLQRKLIPLFHYALRPGGYLFLGTSETIGDFADLFETVDVKAKLYGRRGDSSRLSRPPSGFGVAAQPESASAGHASRRVRATTKAELREIVEQALLAECPAVAALVNDGGDVLYLHGRTGSYLEPAAGEASLNVLKMAREGLRRELTSALRKAVAEREVEHRAGLRVKTNGSFTTVDLTVRPLAPRGFGAAPGLILVILQEARATVEAKQSAAAPKRGGGLREQRAADHEAEVTSLREELRSQEQFLNATNEELKSANEEMQSVNEELQSTNEELETSKEELQSVNEELSTVNGELQAKVTDLSRANDDMANLLAGTGIGTIFVDHQLRILRFTPAVTQIVNLIPSDIGRSVGDLVANLVGYDRLADDVRAVLDTLVPKELEVQTRAGSWQLLRIRPYRTQENVIEGVVVTFTDTTELRQAKERLRESAAERRLAAVVVDSSDAITLQDLDGKLLAWNPAAARLYGFSEKEVLGRNIRDLVPEELRATELAALRQISAASPVAVYRTSRIAKGGRRVAVALTCTALHNEVGDVYALATTERATREDPRVRGGERDRPV